MLATRQTLSVNLLTVQDGAYTQPGSGFDAAVLCVRYHNNELYVSGGFTVAGGVVVNAVTRWDGARGRRWGRG